MKIIWHRISIQTLFICQKFPIHEFFRSDVLWKLFDIGFPYKLLFHAWLPTRQNGVENGGKAYLNGSQSKKIQCWL